MNAGNSIGFFIFTLKQFQLKARKSALEEKTGIPPPDTISRNVADNLLQRRKSPPSASNLINGIFNKEISALSQAITLVESTNPDHAAKASEIVSACLPKSGNSVRIGITGAPGVGKSTFIEAYGKFLTASGKKVAVLAVDPSSSISRGSILGDKTRMESLVNDLNAYIRPSASGETLGGVARKTRESITLCEAFGFDVILVETVGVGQSETAVRGMVDFFLLLKIAGAGDQLQGIKRGIMEMADAILINKADGDNLVKARLAQAEFTKALHFFPAKPSGWTPVAGKCSAILNQGMDWFDQTVSDYLHLSKANGYFAEHRNQQNLNWMSETIKQELQQRFFGSSEVQISVKEYERKVLSNEISPFAAAQELLVRYSKSGG